MCGMKCWPTAPMAAVETTATSVNPTTHGFRRLVTSDIAPSTGIEIMTRIDAIPFPSATSVLEPRRSETIHTAKYSVAIFIEKIVFAKSYSAQLQRSRAGAITFTRGSPGASLSPMSAAVSVMAPKIQAFSQTRSALFQLQILPSECCGRTHAAVGRRERDQRQYVWKREEELIRQIGPDRLEVELKRTRCAEYQCCEHGTERVPPSEYNNRDGNEAPASRHPLDKRSCLSKYECCSAHSAQSPTEQDGCELDPLAPDACGDRRGRVLSHGP